MTEPLRRSDRFRGGKGVKEDEEDKNILQINQQTKDKNEKMYAISFFSLPAGFLPAV